MNTRKLSFYLFAMCLAGFQSYGQATFSNGTKVTVTPGTRISFMQHMTVDNGATLQADGLVAVGGDYNNNGTVNFGNDSKLTFNGSGPQGVNSTNPFALPYMSINNSNDGVTLNIPVTILDTLQMVNGLLYTNATNPVHFANSAASPAESNQSYISGVAIMDTMYLGTGSVSYLGASIASGNDLDRVTIVRNTGPNAVINALGINFIAANWYIATTNNNIGLSLTREVKFSWLSALDNGKNTAFMSLYDIDDDKIIRVDRESQDVSGSNPRVYTSKNVKEFNRVFTLTDTSKRPTAIAVTTKPGHQISVYPNPFTEAMTVKIVKEDTDPVNIYLTDISGKVILQQQFPAGMSETFSIRPNTSLPAGMYLLHVSNEHFTENFKLLKSN